MNIKQVLLCLLISCPRIQCELSLLDLLEKYCEALSALYNITGLYCNATTDEIGTCWPRSTSGRMVERPCPEYINGVKYNTTPHQRWLMTRHRSTRERGASCSV
uniref:Corticotropin-releasing factor receptor 2 n=1 Tax=Paramormyrops kingsleyae TaxID=1676925 RepID=A0A3B3RSH5_9TELE